jgi:FixJ family two-component response regulator
MRFTKRVENCSPRCPNRCRARLVNAGQLEVLALVVRGLLNKEIAAGLGGSEFRVKFSVQGSWRRSGRIVGRVSLDRAKVGHSPKD